MVFNRETGEISKIVSGYQIPVNKSEIISFSRTLLEAGLTKEEIEKIKKDLPLN